MPLERTRKLLAGQGRLADRVRPKTSRAPSSGERAAELADAVLPVDPGNADALHKALPDGAEPVEWAN
jgi:hypothetical protein